MLITGIVALVMLILWLIVSLWRRRGRSMHSIDRGWMSPQWLAEQRASHS